MKRPFKKLRFHILLPFVIMTLFVVILLTELVSRNYIDMTLRQENAKNASGFSMSGKMVNSIVMDAKDITNGIIADHSVKSYLGRNYTSDRSKILARMDVRDYLRMEISNHNGIYGLLLMRKDGSLFGALPYRNVFIDEPGNHFFTEEIVSKITGVRLGTTAWVGPFSGNDLYDVEDDRYPETVMIAIWKMVDVSYGECYVLMLIDESIFADYLSMYQDGNSTLHLLTEDGKEFFRCGEPGMIESEKLLSGHEGGQLIKNKDNESVYVFSMHLPTLGWYLVREVSMAEYERTIHQMQYMVWMLAIAVFLVALTLYMIWLNRFMSDFNALKSAVIRLGQGDLDIRLDQPFKIEEFENMRREFSKTGAALNQQIDTIRTMERSQLELEMRNLQTVLSPHMIFNSLTAIRWMATFLQVEVISDMLTELAEMLRPVLREWRIRWTIREELDHLKHYTRMLDLRYGNRFRLDYDIPEELYELLIPRFTIQPLIENACEHGGRPKKALVVSVTAALEGEWIQMTVSNNGRTIAPEEIERIREILCSGNRGQNIGLYNVYTRLRTCMGSGSTLDVESIPDGGTMIKLRWKRTLS